MINEKNINSRIIHKHDIEANWNKATSFIPKQGELIVYDIDNENNKPRVKIGDGENTIIDLPFITPTVFEWAQASTKPTYTATEVGALPDTTNIPSKTSDLVNDSDFISNADILNANGLLKNSVLPEGYPYKDVGEIFPETVMPIDPESSDSYITDEFELHIGNSYIVNYNGTEYNCEAKSLMMDGIEGVVLGNVGIMDESGETELANEPFLIINIPTTVAPTLGFYGIVIPLDGAEEVTLSIHGNIIKKISKEFLPNIPNISNIVDGSELGSVRAITASDVIGFGSHAEGRNTTASGDYSHAEGYSSYKAFDFITEESTKEEIIAAWNDNPFTLAFGYNTHAEGDNTLALGDYSHAEGFHSVASGDFSHAEGFHSVASGNDSHAEGDGTTASGNYSHAEGDGTTASGNYSHAEGDGTTASGNHSHAEGDGTKASGHVQHVQGKYNIEDTASKYAHIVGNGEYSNPSNAHTLDWDGNAWFAGDVCVGGTGQDDSAAVKLAKISDIQGLATESYVNEGLATKQPIGDYALKSDISDISSAIIDVIELPTENIKENVYYRKLTVSPVINQNIASAYICHCVESLPETGLPATNLDQTEGHFYYVVGNGESYGYVDDMLSMGLNVPAGWYPIATLIGAVGYGYSGTITNIMDDPKDGNFRLLLEYVIYSYKNSWTSHKTIGWTGTGSASTIFNHPINIASGNYSHAEGNNTTASGSSSHAEGENTTASGYASHAEGYSNNNAFDFITEDSTDEEIIAAWNDNNFALAYGGYSHAEGANTLAFGDSAHAEGSNNIASGVSSHAEGMGTTASGIGSHAEGSHTKTSGNYSHAEGYSTTASGKASHAEGYSTTASGGNSHAEGDGTTASGISSHAEGWNTTASGGNSHAEGSSTTAFGGNSHAEGYSTTAFGGNSHAEGYSSNNAFNFITEDSTDEEIIAAWNANKFTLAFGYNSHAEGENTLALARCSHAEGYGTTASGDGSHAEGYSTKASGIGSHAEGYKTTASSEYQHVQGKHNVPDTANQYAHIVGNGKSNTSHSNAHTLDWDGNAWFASDVYVGSTSGVNKDKGSQKLATETYVNEAISNYQYSAKNPPVVVQSEAPTDTSVIWVDIDDNTNDGFQDAINIALAQAKASGEFAPVRGVDYWTVADQQSIVAQTLAALPTWEGGSY